MSTPTLSASPDFAPQTPPRKRVLWKWSLLVTGVFLAFLLWQCGSAMKQGYSFADGAVAEFHTRLNNEQYELILSEADSVFAAEGKHDETVKFFQAIHRKLGYANKSDFVNINVNATTSGTFITVHYSTSFANGPAGETFTWIKRGNTPKLYSYNISSNALIVN